MLARQRVPIIPQNWHFLYTVLVRNAEGKNVVKMKTKNSATTSQEIRQATLRELQQ